MQQRLTKNFWKDRIDPAGVKHPIKGLVLHITDSTSESALAWFNNPAGLSAHYLVCENSDVIQLVQEKDAAWHAGILVNPTWPGRITGENPNYTTIGVEVASLGEFPPVKQWFTWAALCKDIINRNQLALNEICIINHREIRGDKACPGNWFTRAWLFTLLKIIS